jgi:hypothetical protein
MRMLPMPSGAQWSKCALLTLVAVIVMAEPLLSARPLFLRDLGMWHYPVLHSARTTGGEAVEIFPLWTSTIGTGRPLLGNAAYALLHPANLLYLVFGFNRAFNLYIALHVLVAGLGMFWLGRRLELSDAGAFVAAVAFMLGGYVMSCTSQYPMIAPVAWAPVALAVGLEAARRPDRRRIAILAVVLAIQLLGGQPEPTVMTVLIGILWTVSLFGSGSRASGVAVWVIASIGAVALAAAQILPAIAVARHSVRSLGLSASTVLYFSMHPARLVEFVASPGARWLTEGSPPNHLVDGGRALFNSHYLGLSVVLLSVAGCIAMAMWRRDKPRPPVIPTSVVVLTAVAGTVLAMGRYLPGFEPLVEAAPGVIPFRYPVKLVFVTALSVAVLAGISIDAVARGVEPRRQRTITVLVVVIVIFDLLLAHRQMAPVAPVAPAEDHPPLAQALDHWSRELGVDSRQWRVYHHRLPQVGWGPRLVDGEVVDARIYYVWQQRMLLPQTGLPYGIQHAFEQSIEIIDSLSSFRLAVAMHRAELSSMARALGSSGVLWMVSPMADLEPRSQGELVRVLEIDSRFGVPDGSGWLYRVAAFAPRARLTDRFLVAPGFSFDEVVALAVDGEGPVPVVLERDPGFVPTTDTEPPGSVEILADRGSELVLEAVVIRPSLLVVADELAPGWSARVDGTPVNMLRTNGVFRALPLAVGEHVVEFSYRPPLLALGVLVSLAAAAVCALCLRPGRASPPPRAPRGESS